MQNIEPAEHMQTERTAELVRKISAKRRRHGWRELLNVLLRPRERRMNAVAAEEMAPARPRNLREFPMCDLLNREEARIDLAEARGIVTGKSVLISGAGGSIGSELVRQVAAAAPASLVLLDKSENSLFYAHIEARDRLGAARVKPMLVDLLCRNPLREVFTRERPQIVLHAAAHKHVSLLELQPHEAIRNNVLGTRNIAEAALESGAAVFVNLSTDKAVMPASYMGLSKKLTELLIQELAGEFGARFCNVRFGNVAGTTGSVVRLFGEQIERGGPMRVTDPRATRYFMSPREAAHLILRATALTDGGETFVREMGEPVNILALAQRMALFAGLELGRALKVEFTGMRAGEKLSEQMWEPWEHPVPSGSEGILAIRESDPLARGIPRRVERMEALLARDDREGLRAYLSSLFPDFRRNARPVLEMPRNPGAARYSNETIHAR